MAAGLVDRHVVDRRPVPPEHVEERPRAAVPDPGQAAGVGHREKRAEATLVAVEVPDASRFGRVEIDAEGRVQRFTEKQADGKPGWINAGIYCLSRARIEAFEPGRAVSLERDALPGWAAAALLYGHRVRGRFIDIGTPGAYSAASGFFRG